MLAIDAAVMKATPIKNRLGDVARVMPCEPLPVITAETTQLHNTINIASTHF